MKCRPGSYLQHAAFRLCCLHEVLDPTRSFTTSETTADALYSRLSMQLYCTAGPHVSGLTCMQVRILATSAAQNFS